MTADPRHLVVGLAVQHASGNDDDACILWDELLALPPRAIVGALTLAVAAMAAAIRRIADLEGTDYREAARAFAVGAQLALGDVDPVAAADEPTT